MVATVEDGARHPGPAIANAVTASFQINLAVNGSSYTLTVDSRASLLDVLREHLALQARRRAAITANAAPARCTSTAAASSPA